MNSLSIVILFENSLARLLNFMMLYGTFSKDLWLELITFRNFIAQNHDEHVHSNLSFLLGLIQIKEHYQAVNISIGSTCKCHAIKLLTENFWYTASPDLSFGLGTARKILLAKLWKTSKDNKLGHRQMVFCTRSGVVIAIK